MTSHEPIDECKSRGNAQCAQILKIGIVRDFATKFLLLLRNAVRVFILMRGCTTIVCKACILNQIIPSYPVPGLTSGCPTFPDLLRRISALPKSDGVRKLPEQLFCIITGWAFNIISPLLTGNFPGTFRLSKEV